MAALLGGHVMSHSDATGWAPHVDAGTCRLLATYGSKRTKRWPNVPTLNELGYDTVSDSPFGIGGPKGMDPAVTRKLQDAFKKTLEDPQVLATFEKFDQSVIYMNTEEYTKFARDNYQKEKVIIEKLGLAKQG
jgi:tripartite-type tricarboxylate transporter receptor subunit TctC